ncbi:glycoside hydrolase [Martensiomyces pterosporus]|nr:glycoside hydrolase [Martensiomyces pterosporus]
MKFSSSVLAASAVLASSAAAFNVNCNSNYASYYGQNSAGNQQTLGTYCKDATEDVIVLAFMDGFPNMLLNFANACTDTFPGSTLLHCPSMATDIKYCQSQGKAVILSMGGASGAYSFSSDAQASAFADTVWNTFFKGSTAQRPFDDAVLDGIDLDIEGGGSTGYAAFINQLRSHYASDPSKQYYITSAPQCPYPDAYIGSTLNSAWFDMVFVQFYNNYCGLNAYPTWFNYADWDNWAKTSAINKNVKVFIGAPGSAAAASSGYVDGSTLGSIFSAVRANYSSIGGVMTWDVSQARSSGLAGSIRSFLNSGGSCGSTGGTSSSSTTIKSTSTAPSSTSTTSATSATSTTASSTTSQASSTPSNCPVSGAACSAGQSGCSGASYAICNNGSWYVIPCASGTACYLSGNSAVCDWPNGRPTTGCAVSGSSALRKRLDPVKVSKITQASLFPKPAKAAGNAPARVEFVAADITDNQFTTVIKVQSDKNPFTADWTFTFNLPAGQTSDSTKEKPKNMAATFKITGTFADSYALPDTASASFNSA